MRPAPSNRIISRTASYPNIKSSDNGGPVLEIELEGQSKRAPLASGQSRYPGSNTPYELFKKWKKSLAVTDLTRLAWCEQQVDYNERQPSYRRLESRPKSFKSALGKLIKADEEIMKTNDQVTNKGRAIHRALQQTINPQELAITLKSDLDRWAQRMIVMIDSVRSLKEQGCCREMPVFGISHGLVVHGVIDYIEKRAIQTATAKHPRKVTSPQKVQSGVSKLKRKHSSTGLSDAPNLKSKKARTTQDNNEVVQDVANVTPQVSPKSPVRGYQLRISDTKTRSEPGMPSKDDTGPSCLQLMIYRKLLTGILAPPSSSDAVDFDAVWPLVGLSPESKLSNVFVREAKLHRYGAPRTAWNLNELVRIFKESVSALGVHKISDKLGIVYRAQAETSPDEDAAADEKWPVIGKRIVHYNGRVLEEFLDSAFEYWNGERLPEGVDKPMMERRCANCEYKPSCEWRAQLGVN